MTNKKDKYVWYNYLNSKTLIELREMRKILADSPIDESNTLQKVDIVIADKEAI